MAKKYNHIVPKTYQKRWHTSNGDGNVYYFDKKLNLLYNNGGNVKNNMGENYYYILTPDDISFININKFFGDNTIYSKTFVEDYFDKEVESHWNLVLELFEDGGDKIKQPIKKHFEENIAQSECGIGIKSKDLYGLKSIEWLKEFIITQWSRRFENVEPYISKSIDIITENMPAEYLHAHKNELDIILKNKNYMRTVWLASFIDSQKTKEYSLLSVIKNILNDKCNCLVIFTFGAKFILSDNPVIYNMGNNVDSLLGEGLYMALSPDTLIAYLDCSNWGVPTDDVLTFKANDDFVKYINMKLLDQAFDKVGFNSKNIMSSIAKQNCKKSGIKEMFNLVK